MFPNNVAAALLAIVALAKGCGKNNDNISYPAKATDKHPRVMYTTANGIKLNNGGFGSALVQDRTDKSIFYMLTDRGPNVAEAATNTIMIATPDFTPQIGKFNLQSDSLVLLSTILLKNANGVNLNGLPNPANAGATGETAMDINGNTLAPSVDGIDSEGMVQAADGSFWISDE